MHRVNRNSNVASGTNTSRLRWALVAVFAIVGVTSAVSGTRQAIAACMTFPNSLPNNAAWVPCSNQTACNPYTITLACTTGHTIVAYKNSSPPPDWCSCGSGIEGSSCTETAQPCGTTIWFWHPQCVSGYNCTPSPAQDVHFCKC